MTPYRPDVGQRDYTGALALDQEEKKRAAAHAALEFIEPDTVLGVGTGSTANYFIDALPRIKSKLDGTVASSEATAPCPNGSARSPERWFGSPRHDPPQPV